MRSFIILLLLRLSNCVTLEYERTDINSKSKVELSPMLITCGLNDIVIIAAPLVDTHSLYYLHKPNSDVIQLKLPRHNDRKSNNIDTEYDNMVVKYINPYVKTIYPIRNTRVISTSYRDKSTEDIVKDAELSMYGNEFMLGPVMEEDYGNWVLSVYFKDLDDQWTELFQVITLEIVESVPLVPTMPRLKEGATFRLRFAYPIKHLKSCELTAPSSSYDRFFDRSKIELDRCGYVVHNVTKHDEGTWRIIGIGNMMFEGHVNLHVLTDFTAMRHIVT